MSKLDEELQAARDYDTFGQGPHRLGSSPGMALWWLLYLALVLGVCVALGIITYASYPVT